MVVVVVCAVVVVVCAVVVVVCEVVVVLRFGGGWHLRQGCEYQLRLVVVEERLGSDRLHILQ